MSGNHRQGRYLSTGGQWTCLHALRLEKARAAYHVIRITRMIRNG
ncbi:MAG: hypothetical protein ACLFQ1_05015 [Halochromatium sp.]